MPTKVWNEDLLRSLIARHSYYVASDNHKQHIYKTAIVKLNAQRSDIKVQASGTVVNAPKLGSSEVDQLVLRIMDAQNPEQIIPDWAAPYDVGPADVDTFQAVENIQNADIDTFVRNKMTHRGGSYAILMAWNKWEKQSAVAARGYMERDDIELHGKAFMDGVFMPDFHQGVTKDAGWESRTTLITRKYLSEMKQGPGNKIRYAVTALGKKVIEQIIQVYHNGVDPVDGARVGVGAGPADAPRGGQPDPNVNVWSTDLNCEAAREFVADTVRAGVYPMQKEFKGLSKKARQAVHDHCEKLIQRYGVVLKHDSVGQGRHRYLVLTIQGGPSADGVASSSAAPPVSACNRNAPTSRSSRSAPKQIAKAQAKSRTARTGSGAPNIAGLFDDGMNCDTDSENEPDDAFTSGVSPLNAPKDSWSQKRRFSGAGHVLGGDAKRSRLVRDDHPRHGAGKLVVLVEMCDESRNGQLAKVEAEEQTGKLRVKLEETGLKIPVDPDQVVDPESEEGQLARAIRQSTLHAGQNDSILTLAQQPGCSSSLQHAVKRASAGQKFQCHLRSSAPIPLMDLDSAHGNAVNDGMDVGMSDSMDAIDLDSLSEEAHDAMAESAWPVLNQISRDNAVASSAVHPIVHIDGHNHHGMQKVQLVIDERERSRESVARELRNKLKSYLQSFSDIYMCGALGSYVETVPVSDFAVRNAHEEIFNLLIERKAVKDIVGRSVANDQTKQLERMTHLNKSGTNILLIDGVPRQADICKAYGHGEKPSLWDPNVRYFNAKCDNAEDTRTSIRTYKDLLVYAACVLTHGGAQVVFTGDQSLEVLLTGYTAACATPAEDVVADVLFVDMEEFSERSKEIRDKQKTENWNRSGKLAKRRAQERALQQCGQWDLGRVLQPDSTMPDANLILKFSATASFWELYKNGIREDLISISLHGAEGRVTRFGKNLKSIREEGKNQAWFPTAGFGTNGQGFGTIFEELLPAQAPVEDNLVVIQAFSVNPTMASVEYRFFWLRGEELLGFVHRRYKKQCVDTNSLSYSGINLGGTWRIAGLFVQKALLRRDVVSTSSSSLLQSYQRSCLLVTNLADGRRKYAQSLMLSDPLPNNIKMDDLLAIFKACLAFYGVACVNFGQHGTAFSSMLVQNVSYELLRSVAHGEMHFTTDGM